MSDTEKTAPATEEPKREKTSRAAKGNPKAEPSKETADRKTTRDGKPVRKTASGFTVVG